QHRKVVHQGCLVSWLGVEEADDVDSVLRMVQELSGDRLTYVTTSDDDRVLPVRGLTATDRSCTGTSEAYERDCHQPEHEDLVELRMGNSRQPTRAEDSERSNSDHVEYPENFIGRRVVCPLLVVRVQAVSLRKQHPQRKRGQEDEVLIVRPDAIQGT